jgi:serpin B
MIRRKIMRILLLITLVLGSIGSLTGCSQPSAHAMEAKSDLEREESPQVESSDLEKLVDGNSTFAFDLYRALREEEGNLFYSPYSISLALAMTYAGARGETEQQMADTLHFLLSQEKLHPTFNALDLELEKLGDESSKEEAGSFQLNIANSIWGQQDYEFLPEFLDTLALNYGAGLQLVDFINATEEARQTINQWIEDQTKDKIKDLIPEGVLNSLTRLVLANAIYFKASWFHPFDERNSQESSFNLLDGTHVSAVFMSQEEEFNYAEGEGYQAVELPYVGQNTSMVILLPEIDRFESFEASLSQNQVKQILADLQMQVVRLKMPKFEYESMIGLKDVLTEMGMPSAFGVGGGADFSGMDGTKDLLIQDVLHKAFVSVDEEGTEAAAATVVIVGLEAARPQVPVEMTIDHPFIFMIRDKETGTILFLGRVMNPVS